MKAEKYLETEPCGVAKTLKIIGSKWTSLVLHYLFQGKTRFGELQRAMPEISPKTLSQRLKSLQEEGIITKKVYAEVPLHVEYRLTAKGKSLHAIIDTMTEWGEQH